MKIFLIILIAVVVLILLFVFYMGIPSKVSVEEKKMGPYIYAYVRHTGPYAEVGAPMMELSNKLKEAGFNSVDGVGIYYDNPDITPKEELRSDVGSIIRIEDMEKVELNKDKFNFAILEEKDYLTAEFQIKNKLSYMIGPMKVYPLFNKYFKEKNLPNQTKGIEYYDMTNKKIIFMMEK
ncbi:MAG: GyrI-like domain-containing protein [Candidatus Paceibacterota bacterium]|jgi:hypothetical protein